MTTYTRRWIRSGPLTQLARRRRRGEIVRLAGWHGRAAGRSKIWRDMAQTVPVEVRRRKN